MEIGIDSKRRLWIVIDELPALGKLPALSPIMAEGRKYGACVFAGLQSLNQLYSQYGHYEASAIFGQFGTSFFFNNKEPAITKMISSMCGIETITRQQKNTSYGANEFRDGVSYSEHQQKQPLVTEVDLANLSVGECYALLPEPTVRLSKLQIQPVSLPNKNLELIPKKLISSSNNSANQSANNNQDSSDSSRSPSAPNHSVSQKSKQQKNNKKPATKKPTPPKEVELESKAADLL